MEVRRVLPPCHFGFRKGFRTTDAQVRLTLDAQIALSQRFFTLAIFVGIKAAYDNVWPHILIDKLIGCPTVLTRCIQALIGSRNLFIRSGESFVGTRSAYRGLPQGSVISPILCNIYTSDIHQVR